MQRRIAAVLVVLIVCAGGLLGEEIKGKVKSVNADKGTITLTVGDKDQEFKIAKETKIVNAAGKDVPDGLKAKMFQRPNLPVTVTTEKKGGADVVKEVKVGPALIRPAKPIQVKPIQVKPIPIKPKVKPAQPKVQPVPPPKIDT
jgi:hypothetical protein